MQNYVFYSRGLIGPVPSLVRMTRRALALVALGAVCSCSAADIDFTDTIRVVGRVADEQGIGVSNAQVTVTTLATSCTGSTQAWGQGVTDSTGRFAVNVGATMGRRFDGCVEVAATAGIANAFPRVVVRRDSIRIENVLRDSVSVIVQVTRAEP